MAAEVDARTLLESLMGQQITTVTGQPNAVLSVADSEVVVGTSRSPGGGASRSSGCKAGLNGC